MGPLAAHGMHKAAASVKQKTLSVEWGISGQCGRFLTVDHDLTGS